MSTSGKKTVTVTMPDIDPHALRQATRGQTRLAHLLASHQADFASIVVSGLTGSRLRYAVQLWCFEAGEIKRSDAKISKTVIEEVSGSYAGMARHIAKRFPEKSRPAVIVMGSDGRSLMFNPGRMTGEDAEWLLHHVEGKSPAAMIIAQDSLLNKIAQQ